MATSKKFHDKIVERFMNVVCHFIEVFSRNRIYFSDLYLRLGEGSCLIEAENFCVGSIHGLLRFGAWDVFHAESGESKRVSNIEEDGQRRRSSGTQKVKYLEHVEYRFSINLDNIEQARTERNDADDNNFEHKNNSWSE